jgi:hypothetical protein
VELIEVLKKLAELRGPSLERQIDEHNAEVWATARAKGKRRARRKRAVDKAREKRWAAERVGCCFDQNANS